MNRKTITLGILALAILLGTAAFQPPKETPKRNLKVLSKKTSHEELEAIMHGFNDALGVKCGHCHAGSQVEGKFKLNFASDEKPEKEMARDMMRMTQHLNKKYFHHQEGNGQPKPPITCMTCHNGNIHPK